MTDRPALPHDPFGRSTMPAGFMRADRVRLIAEAAEALLEGRMPDPAARLFLGGALRAWLENGGRIGELERTYLRVAAPHRSTMTAARLWARCSNARATAADESGTVEASDLDGAPDEPGEH